MMGADLVVLLGWVGSALVVLSITQRDVRRLRQVNLAASAALLVFNVALGLTSMVVLNVVLAVVNAHHLLTEENGRPAVAVTEPARA